jgi:outer membrane receptor protein involved in Fe transport
MTNNIPNHRACTFFDVLSEKTRLVFYVGVMMLLVLSTLSAQTAGKISGAITDAETGEPLIGCNVIIAGTKLGTATDVDGSFFILNIPAGKYDVQASIIGYDKMVEHDVIVNSGRTTTVNFKIKSTTVMEKEVVVEATRPDVQPEKTSTSEIIRSEDVQQIAGMRDVGDVIGLAADVTDGHFRGGRAGEELYTLQGMGIVNPLDNTSAFLPIMSAVEEVEVITSGFGAQYGNAQSGVVNISMKEGKSDKWRTRVESRMRLPGRKHFGPSVYDPNANPYLSILLDPKSWFKEGDETVYFAGMFDNFTSMFGRDSLVLSKIARIAWLMQARKDINRAYDKQIDYSGEVATGGPIDENLRIFVAFRQNVLWPTFPTEQPDVQQQMMGNVVADVWNGGNLRLNAGYAENNTNVFPSSNGLGFYNWIWDRILSVQYRNTQNTQLGARFTQALSSNTFFELKLNTLITKNRIGSSPAPYAIPDSLLSPQYSNYVNWSKMLAGIRSAPDGFTYGAGTANFRDEKTTTISLEASLTSQANKFHLLSGGLQLNTYLIEVNNNANTRNANGLQYTEYSVKPYELGLYAQDKMEFEGMIANVGLRLDVWNQNSDYYADLISPFRYYDSTGAQINIDLASKSKTPILGRLQPRAGLSFPVSTQTVFHLNYGSFMQRPSFQYVLASSLKEAYSSQSQSGIALTPLTLGNPRLQPQTTNSYDIGIMQGLGEGFTFDVSGYYKDVKNLIQQVTYSDISTGTSYNTYANLDYADIRGFRFSLNKKRGNLAGAINYQYSIATGKSSSPSNQVPAYTQLKTGEVSTDLTNVPLKDILLDFDRTHNVIITLAYSTDESWGPRIGNAYPFGDIIVSGYSTIQSGQPYTYIDSSFSSSSVKTFNNKRAPTEYNTNAKATKRIRNFFGMEATIYFEIFNVFNNMSLNYSYIFDQSNSLSAAGNIERYQKYPIDSPNGIRYSNNNLVAPFLVDQSFLIYGNSPRSYSLGLVVDF